MKKFLPVILLGLGLLVVIGGIIVVFKNSGKSSSTEDENTLVPELPASQRPVITLTPTNNPKDPKSDFGKMLDLKVQKINIPDAVSMDYELIYTTGTGVQQGVPGTVKLDGNDIDRPLLLGSESSGKFRYDVGVEKGTITFRFRNAKGKLMGKLSGEWHLQTDTTELTSTDGVFKYTLDKLAKGVYFIVMTDFKDGYSVFASDGKTHSGK